MKTNFYVRLTFNFLWRLGYTFHWPFDLNYIFLFNFSALYFFTLFKTSAHYFERLNTSERERERGSFKCEISFSLWIRHKGNKGMVHLMRCRVRWPPDRAKHTHKHTHTRAAHAQMHIVVSNECILEPQLPVWVWESTQSFNRLLSASAEVFYDTSL